MKHGSLLMIGDELLDGRLHDSNSYWITNEITERGGQIAKVIQCKDIIDDIVASLMHLSKESSFIIVSGGLGPTTDDLTRHAIAKFSSQTLVKNEEVFEKLRLRYQKMLRDFPESNQRQALFPDNSTMILNPIGTAPGFYVEHNNTIVFSLPGVPSELKAMAKETVFKVLEEKTLLNNTLNTVNLKIFGKAESELQDIVNSCDIDPGITVAYRSSFPEIQLLLKAYNLETELRNAQKVLREKIGEEYIFSESKDDKLVDFMHNILLDSGKTFSFAESCTGGLIGKILTDNPGSSKYFLGSVVTYDNELKKKILDVDSSLINEYGAVSAEVAKAMVEGVYQLTGSDYAISVTGIAGPDGGSEEKPVGTVYIGLKTPENIQTFHYVFPYVRSMMRARTAYTALDILRRSLLKLNYVIT